ncbi:hypothetical protein L602_005200000090 [Cupriavidus gilardii J11]|uniref:Uncharacterized protein n=1 Tax=Cupriavidus gilardii J11 TaxID=936133 RepID=A0A562B5I4_9BURK|nr:hypothetical protein [Cupriavidus gilardii]TWG80249.1 hypothetical protein L602_005200000090 [Cupriavidus gilardii J11]
MPPGPFAGRAAYCRIAHDLGRASVRRGGVPAAAERWGLYGGWAGVVMLISGVRAKGLVSSLRHVLLSARIDLCMSGLGGISLLLGLIEAALAFKRFRDGRCKLERLKQKLASRAGAAVPVRDESDRMVEVDGYLSHRWRQIRRSDLRHQHVRTKLAMVRDGAVQLPGVANGAFGVVAQLAGKLATALPWLGVVGNVLGIGMGVAHIVTGLKQRRLARYDIACRSRDLTALRSRMTGMARAIGDEPLGAAATEQLARFEGMASCLTEASLIKARKAACTELHRARVRTVYGVVSLVVNTAALVLTTAAVAGLIAATGGLALGLAGGLLGAAWLLYANRRLKPAEQPEPSPALGDALACAADGGDLSDAAAAQALEQVCSTWHAEHEAASGKGGSELEGKAHSSYRFIAAARLFDYLRTGDGTDAACKRVTALLRTLGADDELIAAWRGARTGTECRKSLKMMVYYLEGTVVSRGGMRRP